MSFSSSDENFTMKVDTGGRSAWPLPPSAVFKCKSAKPWVNPELFRIGNEELKDAGVMVVDNFSEAEAEFHQQQQNFNSITEDDGNEAIYSEPVEVYGLPLPNSKIKAIEYSNNPEKGIDPGDYESSTGTGTNRYSRNGGCSRKVANHMNENQRLKGHQKSPYKNENRKKKVSPIVKSKVQSGGLLY